MFASPMDDLRLRQPGPHFGTGRSCTYDPRGAGRTRQGTTRCTPSSTPTTCTGSSKRWGSARSTFREQRWRRQHAGAVRRSTPRTSGPRCPTSRRSSRVARRGGAHRRDRGHEGDVRQVRERPGDGEVHPAGDEPGGDARRTTSTSRHRTRRCSGSPPRTTAAATTR